MQLGSPQQLAKVNISEIRIVSSHVKVSETTRELQINCKNFCYHGNGSRSETHFATTVKLGDPENPVWCKNRGHISCISRVIANFLLKFLNSRYHGNGGWPETNFTTTFKLLDPENPLLGAGTGVVSPIQAELLSILCRNFQIFVAMATGVGLAQISLAQLNSPTPKTPY